MKKGFVVLLSAALLAVAAIWLFSPGRCPKPPASELEALAAEISAEGEFGVRPVVDAAGSELAFPRTAQKQRGLFLLNLKTGAMRQFQDPYEVHYAYGYSPDDKYLLFSDRRQNIQLMALSRTGSLRGPFHELPQHASAAWMSSNTFYFSDSATNTVQFLSLDSPDAAPRTLELDSPAYGLVQSGPEALTILGAPGIWSVALGTGERKMLLTQSNELAACWNDTYRPQWLAYSAEKNEYLFCSWDKSNFRHLYRLQQAHDGWQAVQASGPEEHTYNGQWLQRGDGWAYIGNRTNHFYLAVHAANPKDSTNLFVGGHVFGYTVSRDGQTLYAIASIGPEPLGAWEYTITEHKLRFVGGRATLSQAKVVPRQEHWVASFDGLKVPYYQCAPARLNPKLKYPAVFIAPPRASQHYPAWEMFSQFFANIGVYTIAVNHRGLDGYGKAYKELGSEAADKDMAAVYQEVVNNPNIDRKRIFLMGYSAGASAIARTIEHFPGRWAGVIDINGAAPSREAVRQQRLRVFLFSGDADFPQVREEVKDFEKWAVANDVPVHVMHGAHTWHIITDTEINRLMFLEMAEFIFDK